MFDSFGLQLLDSVVFWETLGFSRGHVQLPGWLITVLSVLKGIGEDVCVYNLK